MSDIKFDEAVATVGKIGEKNHTLASIFASAFSLYYYGRSDLLENLAETACGLSNAARAEQEGKAEEYPEIIGD